VGKFDAREVTIGWIRNSMELSQLAMSENLRPLIERNPMLEIVSAEREIEFDAAGNLVPLAGAPEQAHAAPALVPSHT
jgi:hypothetical protein